MMKSEFVVPFVLMVSIIFIIAGCAKEDDWESSSPFSNYENTMLSPSKRYTLEYDGIDNQITLKATRGSKVLDTIAGSDLPDITDVSWGPRDDYFTLVSSSGPKRGLYVYSTSERKYRRSVKGEVSAPSWSADGRYLACIKHPSERRSLPSRLSRLGSIVILDARSKFKPVLTIGKYVDSRKFSPNSARLAFVEVVKDEYGDYSSYSLRTANISTGKISTLITNRRRPDYLWVGNETLAVTVYDKFSVPSIVISRLDGRTTVLHKAPEYAKIQFMRYELKRNMIVYEAKKKSSMAKGDLWELQPGSRPHRLANPKTGGR